MLNALLNVLLSAGLRLIKVEASLNVRSQLLGGLLRSHIAATVGDQEVDSLKHLIFPDNLESIDPKLSLKSFKMSRPSR